MTTYVTETSSSNESTLYDVFGDGDESIMASSYLLALFIVVYALIFVVGVCGNALVVFVVAHNRAMQTITNIFIANLAVADVIMCLLAVPFTPLSGLLHNWVFGDVLCRVVPMAMGASVHVSTMTSTAIAVDRYFVIVHPFVGRMKTVICLLVTGVIWVVAISISLPLAIYQTVTWIEDQSICLCHEQWPEDTSRQTFSVVSLLLQYVVPCSVICFCYVSVSLFLRRRALARIGNSSRSRDQQEIRRKRKTNKMLVAMVTIFVSCWLPLNLIQLIVEYHEELLRWKYFLLTFFVTHVIAMSSTIYNPFLYAWMNENFRKEFNDVIPRLISCGIRRCRDVRRSSSESSSRVRYAAVNSATRRRQMAAKEPKMASYDVIYLPQKETVQLRLDKNS